MFNGTCNVISATIIDERRGNQENLPASGTIEMVKGRVIVDVTVQEVAMGQYNRMICTIPQNARVVGLEPGLDGEAWCVHIKRDEGGCWRLYTDVPTGNKTPEQLKERAQEMVASYRKRRFNH